MTNSISFGARYITGGSIQQRDILTRVYSPRKVSIVQIDGVNEADVKAVSNAVKKWKNAVYAPAIRSMLDCIFAGFVSQKEQSVLAITTQKKNFNKLNSKKIIALAEIDKRNNDEVHLDYLEVNPKYAYPEKSRKYKGIGSCMLDFLKNFYKKTITLNSDFKVTEFYTRNKFNVLQEGKLDYIWEPETL